MKFRTEIEKQNFGFEINYEDSLLFMGSCFTENIGNKFLQWKFNTLVNPFWVLYNPTSIKNSLDIILWDKEFIESDLVFWNEQWHSFSHHGDFSGINKENVLNTINSQITNSKEFIKKSSILFLTFGTAWVYKYNKTWEVVSNCHKFPDSDFTRSLLSVDEIVESYKILIDTLKTINPDLKIIFTVSPIRHIKDTLVGNQISKSTLILAIAKLKELFSHVHYFPSYEICMDDLRDYRFYEKDMIHISEVAKQYIWETVEDTFFSQKTLDILNKIEKLQSALFHRPKNIKSESFKKFINKQLQFINELENNYSFLDLELEKRYFQKYL